MLTFIFKFHFECWKFYANNFLEQLMVTCMHIAHILQLQQDELWVNAHLWYPRSSANRK
jgi:hypothetical protein